MVWRAVAHVCWRQSPFTPFFTEYMYRLLLPVLPADVREDCIRSRVCVFVGSEA
jgi:hypothetical protein